MNQLARSAGSRGGEIAFFAKIDRPTASRGVSGDSAAVNPAADDGDVEGRPRRHQRLRRAPLFASYDQLSQFRECMAGARGFEPPNGGIKILQPKPTGTAMRRCGRPSIGSDIDFRRRERPAQMHRRTYQRLRRERINLEAGLSKRMRRRFHDYASLVAYSD